MVLGVYWYFGFPDGLYDFKRLNYTKGIGGRSDVDAELFVVFESEFADEIVAEIEILFEKFSDAAIFMWRDSNKIQLTVGGRQMFDYDFLAGLEVEKILEKYSVVPKKNVEWNESHFKNWHSEKRKPSTHPEFAQIVGSPLRTFEAETLSLRIDCHIETSDKEKFISDLKNLAQDEKLSVFYYLENHMEATTNLMLFFTNGRQGLGLNPMQSTDIKSFENNFLEILEKHRAKLTHVGSLDFYPKGKPIEILMIDREFVIED